MNILIVLHRVEEAACVFVVVQDELTVLHELFESSTGVSDASTLTSCFSI